MIFLWLEGNQMKFYKLIEKDLWYYILKLNIYAEGE